MQLDQNESLPSIFIGHDDISSMLSCADVPEISQHDHRNSSKSKVDVNDAEESSISKWISCTSPILCWEGHLFKETRGFKLGVCTMKRWHERWFELIKVRFGFHAHPANECIDMMF